MQQGDRVKYSDHVIRPKRDYALGCCAARKAEANRWLNEAKAERGTVVELIPQRDDLVAAIRVQWDSGTESKVLPYMLEPAN